jgi:O-antigen ligase
MSVMSLRSFERRPGTVHVVIAATAFVAVLAVSLGVSDFFFGALGRETTLTGRTELWESLLKMDVDPWFGTGFESFWLGDRTKLLWQAYWWHPNQAHNGYLETYLNLGWLGVTLLGVIAIWGYFNVVDAFWRHSDVARLRLALFVVALVYNATEASFKVMHPIWIAFLLAVAVIPEGDIVNQDDYSPA